MQGLGYFNLKMYSGYQEADLRKTFKDGDYHLSRGTKGELTSGVIRKGSVGAYRKDTHHSSSRRTLCKYPEMKQKDQWKESDKENRKKNKCGVPSFQRQK